MERKTKDAFFRECAAKKFEDRFQERLGRSPAEYLLEKLESGSERRSIEYLYDIVSAEISQQSQSKAPAFHVYYDKAVAEFERRKRTVPQQKGTEQKQRSVKEKIMACQQEFVEKQGTRPFGGAYDFELQALCADATFCQKILQISRENVKIEFPVDTRAAEFLSFKRETIPKRMAQLGLIEHPQVQYICQQVVAKGKSRKSALITIYYAVRMYQLSLSLR